MQLLKQVLFVAALLCCFLFSSAQKKVLDHAVYDQWESFGERIISNNGKYAVYTVNVQEGDSRLVIAQVGASGGFVIPRGYNAAFAGNDGYVVCKIKPPYKDIRDARIKKKKPEDMPKDSLALYNLTTRTLVKIARVKQYKQPEEQGSWLGILLEKALPETPAQPDSATRVAQLARTADSLAHVADSLRKQLAGIQQHGFTANAAKKETNAKSKTEDAAEEGTTLLLKNLLTGEEKTFTLVSDFAFDKNGTALALYSTRKNSDSTSQAHVLWYHLQQATTDTVMVKLHDAHSLAFDEAGTQLAFTAERDSSTKAVQKLFKLWYYKPGMDSATLLADRNTSGVPAGWGISENATLRFSKSGARLFLGTAPILPPKDTTLPEFERAGVDIWNYKDDALQTVQLYNLNRDLKKSYTAVYNWQNHSVIQLADEQFKNIELTDELNGNVFYAATDTGRRVAAQWQGYTFSDVYAIDAATGKRSLVEKNFKGNMYPSATGKYLLLYHDRKRSYTLYNSETHSSTPVVLNTRTPLYDVENDVPDDPNPYGIMGWAKNDSLVYIYDQYNVYAVQPDGKKAAVPVFVQEGKKRVRYVKTDEEEHGIDISKPACFWVYDETTKLSGFSKAVLQQLPARLERISADTVNSSSLVKAKEAGVYLWVKESFSQSPALLISGNRADSVQSMPGWHTTLAAQLYQTNPQQSQYYWGTASLYKWKAYTGKLTEGVLYKPENFDPKKKYPMIVYFYERNNNTLYNYQAPAPTPSRLNIPFFVSRGYIVFVPDIWYTTGHPGKSAYDYIVSGTRALMKEGFVDSTKIGLQGQSWGGYQTAYLITQTNLYAAAWAGAPVVNMFSAYGGIRWESGLNRQFQYEKTQSRIGATIWEKPELYVENSPLFHLQKVKTPLVIMSNDADGAVPWYQGIEFFTAMRRLNKPVWLLNYNGEAHNLVERRNRKDIQIREQEYFDWLLQGAVAPKWITDGVPAVMKGRTWALESSK
ncbi:alpha/beta hydrolase family protein [Deminuibacter soli]|uniref:S9 family peptidase n=1 Tax=Deminuibacter soli TaxID=2291815 RepID=A0A3E1NHZ3_9BACT|nr:prolyl oligopeptidase family serine peptidase [Deminuibacter soli]RFM27563.1 S9 family peptidase [Deminuibacter soli]